ncbi:hypothetical protein [Phreatobacter stygius]|uniref:Alpha/beta hydrolase n=1 Tax=Phreatobacter stygius TaxID=1940610 RepID=A0A4D7B224_9HYPH|nr:hypothetical protein [Phreatobacter stygius]QCI66851.1 hypothetical protein E8M01_22970 [Phreatobacter stygius]
MLPRRELTPKVESRLLFSRPWVVLVFAMDHAAGSESIAPVIVLVHGTVAGSSAVNPSQNARWWQRGGPFATGLAGAVQAAIGNAPDVEEFRWSGANSEVQRRLAGKLLLNRLVQLEGAGRPYHLIGHSHGGSVIWHALTASMADAARRAGPAAEALPHLRSWATVGTPFLTFGTSKRELFGVILLLVGFLLWLATWSTWILDVRSVVSQAGLILQNATDWSKVSTSYAWYRPIWRETPTVIAAVALGVLVYLGLKLLGWGFQVGRLASSWTPALTALAATTGVLVASRTVPFVAGLHQGIAGKIGLVVMALLLAVIVLVVVVLLLSLAGHLLNMWDRQERRLRAQAAYTAYGQRWYSLVHRQDEAISALGASLLPAPAIRPMQRDTHGVLNDKVLRAISALFTKGRDEAIWEGLTQRVQGDDMSGYVIRRVGLAPPAFTQVWPPLSGAADASMMALADSTAGAFAAQLRERFSASGKAGGEHDTVDQIVKDLSFGGLVHNSYFFEDAGRTKVRQDVLGWLAAHIIGATPQPAAGATPVPRLHGALRDTSAAASDFRLADETRFRTVTIARLGVLAMAFGSVMLATTTAFETAVRPLTREAQVAAAIEAWKRSGTFATADAPMVGAFVVRLAAMGELDTAAAVQAIFRNILERNSRAVTGQRLAFAWGRDGALDQGRRAELVGQVRTEILEREPGAGLAARAAHLARANHLVTLHLMAGIVSRDGRLNPDQVGQAAEAWAALNATCRDLDLDAAARVYLPLLLAGDSDPQDAVAVLDRIAARREGQCGVPDNPVLSDADRAWQRAFLVDLALDAISWNQPDLAGKLLTLQGGSLSHPQPLLAALDGTRNATRTACVRTMQDMAGLLRSVRLPQRASDCSARSAEDPPPGWIVQPDCDRWRQGTAAKLQDYSADGARLRSLHADLDVTLMNSYRFCRVEPGFAGGNLRSCAARLAATCAAASEAAQKPIDLALVLIGMSRFSEALDVIGPVLQGTDLWLDDTDDLLLVGLFNAAFPMPRDAPPLGRERQVLIEAIVAQQLRLARPCPGRSSPILRPCARGPERRAINLRSAAFMLFELGRKAEARSLVADLVADIDRRSGFNDRLRASLRELLAAADAALIVELREESRRMVTYLGADLRRRGLAAIEAASEQSGPFTAEHIRVLVAIMAVLGDPNIPAVTEAISDLRDKENTRDTRAALSRQLAGIRAGLGDFFLANREANSAVAANEVLAGLCTILDHHIEKNDALRAVKGRYGLLDHHRWPQPAPSYFHTHARFGYAAAASRPLACRTGPSYDID